LEKTQYVALLGHAEDPKLAQRALDLALTDEEPPTLRPRLIRAVSGRYPEMAVDFTIKHWDQISPLLESDSRPQFVPKMASGSMNLKTLEPLNAFAKAHMPPTTHRVLAKSVSAIRYNAQVVTRLAQVDKWIGDKNPSPQPSPAAGRGSLGAP
jgi:aminopeptidase N